MNRKYRHQGYMSEDEDRGKGSSGRSQPRKDGPRSPRMTSFHQLVRCKSCGKPLPASFDEISQDSRCPSCHADLHTCTNCSFFDPSSRFECTQPITERISPKDRANECPYFEARQVVEKETTANPSHEDPRDAFERLFKS